MKNTKITFYFNYKSSSHKIPTALSIAEKCGGIKKNDFYQIDFDSVGDQNLKILFDLVGDLKGTHITINNGKPIDAREFFYVVNCSSKQLCKEISNSMFSSSDNIDDKNRSIEGKNWDIFVEKHRNEIKKIQEFPKGYICKKIRREDGVIVDVSYKSIGEMIEIWENTDFQRDKYITNTIKSLYDEEETLIYRNVKRYEKKYDLL